MFDNMENLKIISSFHAARKPYGKVEKRKTNGFIFQLKGYSVYVFGSKTLTVNEGDMIFLPEGSSYVYKSYWYDENLYTSINFHANLENSQATVYSLEDFYGANYIANNFSELWKFGNVSDKYKCLSIFYDLLSFISRIEHLKSSDERKSSLIEPAVKYLKNHIYDSELKVNKLHKKCGISDTYFRKIFISKFNMTPQKYVMTERVLCAKSIIESGDFESIKEVSNLVGFNDPLYFSKVFKKAYGVSPSNMND